MWGDFGASWLGWDSRAGRATPSVAPELTDRPRRYGFHGTIKPPFQLLGGTSGKELADALQALCADSCAVALPSLRLSRIGRFLALTAPQEQTQVSMLADKVVRDLDRFRAPLTDADLARRRSLRLTDRQEALLVTWGYPYVMDQFRFHLTLTGPVKATEAAQDAVQAALEPLMQQPLSVDSLSLMGEAADGFFHEVARFSLPG